MIQAELGTDLEDYVHSLVAKGTFPSEAAALRTGVELIREREDALAKFDAAIAEGLADIEAGRVHQIDEVRERLRARSKADMSSET